ncbi:MAG: winged helix-turn-helix transcriptional regulator [Phycisphaerales bacterium]
MTTQPPTPGLPRGTISRLVALVHRRWTLHVLAAAHAHRGGKLVSLAHAVGASPASVRDSAAHLVGLGLLVRPEGLGHPLRPEYVVPAHAEPVAAAAADLVAWMDRRDAHRVLTRKWSLPIVWAIGPGSARFRELQDGLRPATDRALSLGLESLRDASLVERRTMDTGGPATDYRLGRRGRSLLPPLAGLMHAV